MEAPHKKFASTHEARSHDGFVIRNYITFVHVVYLAECRPVVFGFGVVMGDWSLVGELPTVLVSHVFSFLRLVDNVAFGRTSYV